MSHGTAAREGWNAEWSEELERDYNLREAFPDHPRYFADWRGRSAAARARLAAAVGLAYGPGPRQKLDLFRAAGRRVPLLVFVHGGYWRTMDRSDFSFLAEPLVARGVSVAIPSYSLCPQATLDDIVQDVRAGFTWIGAHADSYGVDPERIHLSGWSAGAQLAAMLVAGLNGATQARSAFLLSGIYDLRPIRHTRANDDLRLDAPAAARNSPLLLRPGAVTRLAVAAGALETAAFRKQSRDLAAAWGAHLPEVSAHEIAGVHHYGIVSELGDAGSVLFGLLLGQIRS